MDFSGTEEGAERQLTRADGDIEQSTDDAGESDSGHRNHYRCALLVCSGGIK